MTARDANTCRHCGRAPRNLVTCSGCKLTNACLHCWLYHTCRHPDEASTTAIATKT